MRKNLQNTDTMIIDQALFGYSDAKGHHCYIKTLDLPEDVFQQILILSDKTGPMNQTFRSYLTGFPIDKLQVYALIKTWIATNISRRGAVWSHVLFIKFKDLENIKDLSVLQQLFVKPMRNDSFIAYRDSISINYSKINRDAHCSNLKGYSDSFIKDCLFELFRASSNKLFLSSNSPNEFDTLIFALWRIQWPELRKIFTFCTGLLSVLESEKDLYDIQVVPDHLKERYRQRYQNISFIQDNSNISKPEWVDYLYNILNNNQAEKKFNDFIQYFSQNVYDRFYISKLTASYIALQNDNVHRLLSVCLGFQRMSRSEIFMQALFGIRDNKFNNALYYENHIYELMICNIDNFSGLDATVFKKWIIWLYEKEYSKIEELLSRLQDQNINSIGNKCMDGIADELLKQDFIEKKYYQIAQYLIDQKSGDFKIKLMNNLALNKENLEFIICSCGNELEELLKLLIVRDPQKTIDLIMNWLNESFKKNTSDGLKTPVNEEINKRIPDALKNIINENIKNAIEYIVKHNKTLNQNLFDYILDIIKETIESNDPKNDLFVLLFCIGFKNVIDASCQFLVMSFQSLIDLAENEMLSDDNQKEIKQLVHCDNYNTLDPLDEIKDQIQILYAYYFYLKQEFQYKFFEGINNNKEFCRIVKLCLDCEWGEKFLEKIANIMLENGMENDRYYQALFESIQNKQLKQKLFLRLENPSEQNKKILIAQMDLHSIEINEENAAEYHQIFSKCLNELEKIQDQYEQFMELSIKTAFECKVSIAYKFFEFAFQYYYNKLYEHDQKKFGGKKELKEFLERLIKDNNIKSIPGDRMSQSISFITLILFTKHNWPKESFLYSIKKKQTLDELYRQCDAYQNNYPREYTFLMNIKALILTNKIKHLPFQKEIVSKYPISYV